MSTPSATSAGIFLMRKEYKEAYGILKNVHLSDDPLGNYFLAEMNFRCLYVTRDKGYAYSLFRKSSVLGCVEASARIACGLIMRELEPISGGELDKHLRLVESKKYLLEAHVSIAKAYMSMRNYSEALKWSSKPTQGVIYPIPLNFLNKVDVGTDRLHMEKCALRIHLLANYAWWKTRKLLNW